MKTNSCWSSKVKQNVEQFFTKALISRIGRASGFICRTGARITPFSFMLGLIQCCCTGCNTYSGWAAAIGTISDKDSLSAGEVAEVYRVRWFIELLFKGWKSGGHLQTMLHQGCTHVYRVKTIIYLLLVFFCLVIQHVYVRHFRSIEKRTGRFLSIIKLLAFVCNNLTKIIGADEAKLKEILTKHCCYEQRNDRVNIIELIYPI